MIEQASLVIGEGNWAVKSDSLLGYKINNGKYYPREMSVVRATTGTRINEDGLVEVVPYNLIQHSESLTTLPWIGVNDGTGTAPIITSNYSIAPNGTQTAERIQFSKGSGTTSSDYSLLLQGSLTLNVSGTLSIYLKSNTSSNQNVVFYWAGGQGQVCVVTPQWQRFTVNNLAATTSGIAIGARGGNIYFSGGDNTLDVSVWGAQLVEGTSALDYLPTTDRLDVARIDYSSGSAALLVEPQRTNLSTWSNDFSNAVWTKNQSTITSNYAVSPQGIQNASRWLSNSGATLHYLSQLYGFTLGQTYTISCYVKSNTSSNQDFRLGIDGNVSSSNLTATTEWQRFTFTASPVSAVGLTAFFISRPSTNAAVDLLIYGLQLELGSYPTSYIPTQGSTVTRNADVISKTGIADLIGQTEGTLFTEVIYDASIPTLAGGNDQPLLVISNGTSNNYISILLQGSNDNKVIGYCLNGGSLQALIASSAQTSGTIKIAVSYKSNYFALFVNGVKIGQDTSFNVPATNQLNIGSYLSSGSQFLANVKTSAIWKTQLTDAQCQTLTTI